MSAERCNSQVNLFTQLSSAEVGFGFGLARLSATE